MTYRLKPITEEIPYVNSLRQNNSAGNYGRKSNYDLVYFVMQRFSGKYE